MEGAKHPRRELHLLAHAVLAIERLPGPLKFADPLPMLGHAQQDVVHFRVRIDGRLEHGGGQFADGWVIESIRPAHFEPNSESKETFTDGGPRAWFAILRRGS